MSHSIDVAHDPSVADRVLSHQVRKYRRATSPRCAQGGTRLASKSTSQQRIDSSTSSPNGIER